jgi:hypothetical protein
VTAVCAACLAVANAAREAWAARNLDHASQAWPIKADAKEMTKGQEADYAAPKISRALSHSLLILRRVLTGKGLQG